MVFRKYLTPSEEKQLFAHMSNLAALIDRRDLHWITFMRYTGIRVYAMSQFTCGDARKAIEQDRVTLRAEIQKGEREHSIHLLNKARESLLALLFIRKEMNALEEASAPLVIGLRGRGMTTTNYRKRLHMHAKNAGLALANQISPHWLRHTLAKRLIARSTAEDPLGIVQGVLGHANRNTTAIYTQPDREQIKHEMEAYA